LSTLEITTTLLNFTESKASSLTPEQLFAYFADQSWAFWLDSCDSEHPDCQYDIMVWQPSITLVTHDKNTDIGFYNDDGVLTNTKTSIKDPLWLVEHHQNQLFADKKIPTNVLPFLGGAVGYFAYDLGRQFEQLPDIAAKDINLPEMAVGIYQQALIFDHKNQQFYLICPNNKKQTLCNDLYQLVNRTLVTPQAFKITEPWQSNINKNEYAQKFTQVQDYLHAGDCYQINLAQRFKAAYQGDEYQAYLALRQANNAPFSAFMRFENNAILSISPERFLQVDHNSKVQSKPIKGTRPRSSNANIDQQHIDDLKNASKDQAENLMIVDLLRNDISKACLAGSIKVPKLFSIESFPAVHHLVSTVEGTLSEDKSPHDLLRGAFPGGSITGAPKVRAMEIIEQLEPNKRTIYCGSIGYISACGKMDSSITIRTLICQQANTNKLNNHIFCWAGGGLVADSKVNDEYQETFDKVNKILPILSKL